MANAVNENKTYATLEGDAYYAFLHRPKPAKTFKKKKSRGTFTTKEQYQVDLLVTEKTKEVLEKFGMSERIRNDNPNVPGEYIRLTSRYDPEHPERKPSVVDANVEPVPPSVIIGNGSKVKVRVFVATQKDSESGETFHVPYVNKVQILDLVPYVPKAREDDIVKTDGYVAPASVADDDAAEIDDQVFA